MLFTRTKAMLEDADTIAVGGALRGTPEADQIKGTSEADVIRGFAGADALYGRRGDDTLYGGLDVDLLRGGPGKDTIYGGGGADDLRGQGGNDRMEGGAGADTLRAGGGNDTLIGGVGADSLFGGRGADRFRVSGDGEADSVQDFSALEGDKIDAVGFTLLGLTVDLGAGITTATFDGNGDGVVDAVIEVNGILDPISIIL